MKVSLHFAILFFPVIFICSCSCKPEKSVKPISTLEISPSLKNYILGQSISFRINTKLKKGKLKNTDVYLNDILLVSNDQLSFSYMLPAVEKTGVNTVRIISETTDGLFNTRIYNFTALSDTKPVRYTYSVVREYNHPADHFTQGLQLHEGYLYEGTGENGKSSLYKISFPAGKVLLRQPLEDKYFGEGITILNDKVYQLTYKNQVCFIFNLSDFARVDSFRFHSKEGWGLTHDGESLIMSDGTETLTWIDPVTFAVKKRIQVADDEKIYQYLNELEYDNGSIWANVWTTNRIIRIDAQNGKVTGYIDLDGILSVMAKNQLKNMDVLNGIALFPGTGHLLITGKLWPAMFEISISVSE